MNFNFFVEAYYVHYIGWHMNRPPPHKHRWNMVCLRVIDMNANHLYSFSTN